MTSIEEKRFEYIKLKHAEFGDDKVEFIVRTGLTFDPNTKKKVDGEEKAYKDIDWYYPKGAAFKNANNEGGNEGGGNEGGGNEGGGNEGGGNGGGNEGQYSEITVTYDDVKDTMTQEEFDAIDANGDGQITLRPSVTEDGEIMTDENGDIIYSAVTETP